MRFGLRLGQSPLFEPAEGESHRRGDQFRVEPLGSLGQERRLAQIALLALQLGKAGQYLGMVRLDLEAATVSLGRLLELSRCLQGAGQIPMGDGELRRHGERLLHRFHRLGGLALSQEGDAQVVVQLEPIGHPLDRRPQQFDGRGEPAFLHQQAGEIDHGHRQLRIEGDGLAVARFRGPLVAAGRLGQRQAHMGAGEAGIGGDRPADQGERIAAPALA